MYSYTQRNLIWEKSRDQLNVRWDSHMWGEWENSHSKMDRKVWASPSVQHHTTGRESPPGKPWWTQMVKLLSAIQESRVRSLGWKEPLKKGMATLSSILAWRITWAEEPDWLQSLESQRFVQDWVTNTRTHPQGIDPHVTWLWQSTGLLTSSNAHSKKKKFLIGSRAPPSGCIPGLSAKGVGCSDCMNFTVLYPERISLR